MQPSVWLSQSHNTKTARGKLEIGWRLVGDEGELSDANIGVIETDDFTIIRDDLHGRLRDCRGS
jgi:hypothetical protein